MPSALYIEPVNICNADCIFCAYQFDERPKRFIDDHVFKKTIDEYCERGGKYIDLTPFAGEIFVDPEILDKVEYIKAKGLNVRSYTNATLLHRFDMKRLLNAGFTSLHISVSPLDESLYRKIFRSHSYKRVVENIRMLLIAFRETEEKTVKRLSIEFRADRPLPECQALPDYKKNVAPYLSEGVEVSAMRHYDSWSGMIKPSDLLDGMALIDPQMDKRLPCARIFELQVLSDGQIRLCGCRYDNAADHDELAIGHIQENSIEEAYHSKDATDKIMSFYKGELLDVCKKCSWYAP